MKYVLEILHGHLRQEVIALQSAKHSKSDAMSNLTAQAFAESRRLAEERIPQLEEAIKILENL